MIVIINIRINTMLSDDEQKSINGATIVASIAHTLRALAAKSSLQNFAAIGSICFNGLFEPIEVYYNITNSASNSLNKIFKGITSALGEITGLIQSCAALDPTKIQLFVKSGTFHVATKILTEAITGIELIADAMSQSQLRPESKIRIVTTTGSLLMSAWQLLVYIQLFNDDIADIPKGLLTQLQISSVVGALTHISDVLIRNKTTREWIANKFNCCHLQGDDQYMALLRR